MIVPVPLSKLWVYENKSEGGKRGSEDLSQICAPPPPPALKVLEVKRGRKGRPNKKRGN